MATHTGSLVLAAGEEFGDSGGSVVAYGHGQWVCLRELRGNRCTRKHGERGNRRSTCSPVPWLRETVDLLLEAQS